MKTVPSGIAPDIFDAPFGVDDREAVTFIFGQSHSTQSVVATSRI